MQILLEVEYSLFPVSVRSGWSSTKADWGVAVRKLTIPMDYQGMDHVFSHSLDNEVRSKR